MNSDLQLQCLLQNTTYSEHIIEIDFFFQVRHQQASIYRAMEDKIQHFNQNIFTIIIQCKRMSSNNLKLHLFCGVYKFILYVGTRLDSLKPNC